jgi:hypothetical protein
MKSVFAIVFLFLLTSAGCVPAEEIAVMQDEDLSEEVAVENEVVEQEKENVDAKEDGGIVVFEDKNIGVRFSYPSDVFTVESESDRQNPLGGSVFLTHKENPEVKLAFWIGMTEGIKTFYYRPEFENFQQTVSIGNGTAKMWTYTQEDLGKINAYTQPGMEGKEAEYIEKEITQEVIDEEGAGYRSYVAFTEDASCEDVNFGLIRNENREAQTSDSISVICKSSDPEHGKQLLDVYDSIEFTNP